MTDGDEAKILRLAEEVDRLDREYDEALGLDIERGCRDHDLPDLMVMEGRCTFEPQVVID